MNDRDKNEYAPLPETIDVNYVNFVRSLPNMAAQPQVKRTLPKKRLVLVIAMAMLMLAGFAIAANQLGVLEYLETFFVRKTTHLSTAGELIAHDIATITAKESEMTVREVLYDGTQLYIMYTIRDLDGTPIDNPEEDLTMQLQEPESLTHAAKRDDFVGMVRYAEINGVETPFGSHFFLGENSGEMVYAMECNMHGIAVGDSFEVGLAALMNEDGWYYIPDVMRFSVNSSDMPYIQHYRVTSSPQSFEDCTVQVTAMWVTPLRTYFTVEWAIDAEADFRQRREISSEWGASIITTQSGDVVAETSYGGWLEGDPRESFPETLYLHSANGQVLELTMEEVAQ
ncbi:MAG: DUF4179 domain-containing protein [Clostridiales bacterium]|nr:DUF4179 domain-containing protein [Clostridiales bacterium]